MTCGSSSLKFNAVAEWWEDYIAYDALKKLIYQLEKKKHNLDSQYHDIESNEHSALISQDIDDTDVLFKPALDGELQKIVFFYGQQEKDLLQEVSELEKMVEQQELAGLAGHPYLEEVGDDDEEEDDDDDEHFDPQSPIHSRDPTGSTSRRRRRRRTLSSAGFGRVPELHGRSSSENPQNRHSISSGSEEANDLEASIVSLRPPEVTSKSPVSTVRRLARKLPFMGDSMLKDSIASLGPENIWTSQSNYAYDTRLLYKRRITTQYIALTSLKAYVEVNYSGFRKILKKYDKVTDSNLKDRYLHEVVERALPFTQASKDRLNDAISRLLDLYAKCVTQGDKTIAKQQLRLHQRENIAWERDTVWRQMIGRERRGELDGEPKGIGSVLLQESDAVLAVPTPVGRIRIKRKHIYAAIAVAVFVILLNVQTVEGSEANKCFAILMFSTVLWATEAIPLFVTSMFIPLLMVCLRVIRSAECINSSESPDCSPLTPQAATKFVFGSMFSPTIMLLIGGFTISSALSKTNIDRILVTRVLSLAGSRPSTVILAFMGVSCFASMWISNVAAPTLCFTLIRPILRTLPPKASFGPCLILAIALAANIGGQSSPISSPQNIIALEHMNPPLDWGSWFAVAIPVSAVSILLIWLLLLASYRPARSPDGEGEIEIRTVRPTKEPFTWKQIWVSFVCLVTIFLWCIAHSIEDVVGDMGVIAIIPIVAFFSTGVLKKDDFEQFMWTIVFLAMGGIALGKGVESSGLLGVMDTHIRDLVEGLGIYTVVMVLTPIVLVVSTFISHTIASVLLVPIAQEVGKNLDGNHANLLVFITGLICSAGMGMPVSGFPNQTAATQENELGELYLSNTDFLKNGVPASIIAAFVVSTVGYLLMGLIGSVLRLDYKKGLTHFDRLDYESG
ncbi:low-affinity phosphate transporter [Pleurotus ostreatus]|uniref:Low-affinity phosphate transporter n=1 Tax=Pleurotus ostreatus TaxID=5322 RepID=A0A8H6ZSF1_PLEOS|nr:low-affinity phosphate transporter [Pleurotus ostreatus]KAF7424746.1 low-affinity phosphate transporter [Pleurotus ostreatus]